MKEHYDLWALPQDMAITVHELDAAIQATFERRRTDIPRARPPGLSCELINDEIKQRQWRAYAASIELEGVLLADIVEAIWTLVGPSCRRLAAN